MKTTVSLFAVALLIATGCNQSNPGGQQSQEFKVAGPATEPTIKQGTTQTIELSVNRDKNFKETVQLQADNPPEGIKAKLLQSTVKPGDDGKVSLEITAAKNAPPGEHTITVTATPEKGSKATLPVKVKVTAAS
jgi:uncharacterized membrane protein